MKQLLHEVFEIVKDFESYGEDADNDGKFFEGVHFWLLK